MKDRFGRKQGCRSTDEEWSQFSLNRGFSFYSIMRPVPKTKKKNCLHPKISKGKDLWKPEWEALLRQ